MILFISFLGNLLWTLSIFWAYQKIAGLKVNRRKMGYVIIIYLLFTLLEMFGSKGDLLYSFSQITGISLILLNELEIFFFCWIITLLIFDRNLKRSLFLTAAVSSSILMLFLSLNGVFQSLSNGSTQLFLIFLFLMILILLALVYLIVEKLDMARLYQEFEYKNYSFMTTLGLTLVILLAYDLVYYFLTTLSQVMQTSFLVCILIVFVMALSMVYYLNILSLKDKKKYSDMMLTQQNLYIQHLEKIQQNMRTFKHDYKNMMSSLYLQSKEGHVEEMEKTLSRLIDDFDEDIGKKMNLTNQLSNILISEVKSLLIQKITKIDKYQIPLHLEVLYPIQAVKINIMDLCRILGILLDNAIEEVRDDMGDINIVLSNQEAGLHIIIDNKLFHEVNMPDLFREGYTTKDSHHGIGLISLQKIIEKYPNVTHAVQIKDNRFIHEISILHTRSESKC